MQIDPDTVRAIHEEMTDLDREFEHALLDEEDEAREVAVIDDPSDPLAGVEVDAPDSYYG